MYRQEVQLPVPLAVYREIAAHLRQVKGVEIDLYQMQSEQFDYNQSQVGGLWIHYTHPALESRKQVEQILAYYRKRYGVS